MVTKVGKEWSEDFPGTQEVLPPLAVTLATRIMPMVPEFPILKLEWEYVNEPALPFLVLRTHASLEGLNHFIASDLIFVA